ncbi:hypothetical protein HK102_003053, partial [Quaeritorhiza haematococci]
MERRRTVQLAINLTPGVDVGGVEIGSGANEQMMPALSVQGFAYEAAVKQRKL